MIEYEGRPVAADARIGIAVARWNEDVTGRLLTGALDALAGAGVDPDQVEVAWVPGSFELPLACENLARTGRFDAVLALGAVIRGETDHYDYICSAATDGVLRVSLDHRLPVLFGVLTCEDRDQALARAGGGHGNKGADCALDALRLLDLYRAIAGDSR